jgi:molybdate transport system regulatory protein
MGVNRDICFFKHRAKGLGGESLEIRIKVWLDENDSVLFGDGRLQLLRAIESAGSMAAAAREMSMSYRAAWGRLHASEDRLGFALVERSEEGRRAMVLTEAAKEIMALYAELEKKAEDFVDQHQGDLQKALKKARAKKN